MVGMAKAKTTKAYTLRAATQGDLKAIMGLYNWAVNQTFATIDSEPLDAEEAQHWWEMHGKRSKLLVATDETGVIGWARLLPWKQRGFDVVESLVYVDPVHHGNGIGGTLLDELMREDRGEHSHRQSGRARPVHSARFWRGGHDQERGPQVRSLDGHHFGPEKPRL